MEKQRRPYFDGTFDLKAGLTCLLIGVYYLLPPIPTTLASIFLFILALILIGGSPWLIDRLTVSRKGMALQPGPQISIFIAILAFLAWAVLFSFTEQFFSRWMPILPALILAAILASAGLRSRVRRYLLLAFIGLLVAFVLAWVNLGAWTANLFLVIMGVILIVSGIIALWNSSRNDPLLQEGSNGH